MTIEIESGVILSPEMDKRVAPFAASRRELSDKISSIDILGPPQNPDSVIQIIDSAKNRGHQDWLRYAYSELESLSKGWLDDIRKKGGESSAIYNLLSDEDLLRDTLLNGDFGRFVGLREYYPNAWRHFLTLLSVRQSRILDTGIKWTEKLTDEALVKMNVNRTELKLLFDLSKGFQEPVDIAFLKQTVLADAKGGVEKRNITATPGSEFLYGDVAEDGASLRTFHQVFTPELDRMLEVLDEQIDVISEALDRDELSEDYKLLVEHLQNIKGFVSNDKADIDTVRKLQIAMNESYIRLCESGCSILPHIVEGCSVAGEAGINDIGFVVGFRSKDMSEFQEQLVGEYDIRSKAVEDEYRDNKFGAASDAPKGYFVVSVNKTGSNLYWDELGISGEFVSLVNINEVVKRTKMQFDKVSDLFDPPISFDEYLKAVLLTTYAHEAKGHGILNIAQEKLLQIIKTGYDVDKFDELKADCVGAIPYKLLLDEGLVPVSAEAYLSVLLGWYLTELEGVDDLGDNEFNGYVFAGDYIAHLLLSSGSVEVEDGKFNIVDAKKGITLLAEEGYRILDLLAGRTGELSAESIKDFVRRKQGELEDSELVRQYHQMYKKSDEF